MRSHGVKYFNEYARFVDSQTIEGTNKKGVKVLPQFIAPSLFFFFATNRRLQKLHTARRVIIAIGERPWLPQIPGIEHAITSDDIFTLDREPGETLIVGGAYVALETAGFLQGSVSLDPY